MFLVFYSVCSSWQTRTKAMIANIDMMSAIIIKSGFGLVLGVYILLSMLRISLLLLMCVCIVLKKGRGQQISASACKHQM